MKFFCYQKIEEKVNLIRTILIFCTFPSSPFFSCTKSIHTIKARSTVIMFATFLQNDTNLIKAFVIRWTMFINLTRWYNASTYFAFCNSFQDICTLLMTFTLDVFPFPTLITLMYTNTFQSVSVNSGPSEEVISQGIHSMWFSSTPILTSTMQKNKSRIYTSPLFLMLISVLAVHHSDKFVYIGLV